MNRAIGPFVGRKSHIDGARLRSPPTLRQVLCQAQEGPQDGASSAGGPVGLWQLLPNGLGLDEQQQVVRPAALGVRATHVEPAEGVHPHQSSRTLSIEVQVADVEFFAGALDTIRVAAVECACQSVPGAVGDAQGVLEVLRFGDG